MIILVIFGVIAFSILVVPIIMYNTLVTLRNHCREAWSGIDTELKRRYELIPNLVATVKGYMKHERETLELLTAMRARAIASTGSPELQAMDENQLIRVLRTVIGVVENYPDLKASDQFRKLQQELINTEDRIQAIQVHP